VQPLRDAQVKGQDPLPPAETSPGPTLRIFFWCVIAALGLLQAWAHRNGVSPDSISYIEIAWAAARSGLHQLVNGHWSPLYPFFLSLVFRTVHPIAQWEFAAAHLLNFALYLASLASFELFLKELIGVRESGGDSPENSSPVPARPLWIWGYVYFLWAGFFWLGTEWVTPDLCVAVVVYLATALLLRIRRGQGGWLTFAGLGASLGLGYLAKTGLFPLSFVFFFCALCLCRLGGTTLTTALLRTTLAVVVFAVFALPQIVSLSMQKGRVTFGDAGALNYAMHVNHATKYVHWQGEPSGTGIPAHPTRKILSDPAVFEFASPIQGTYPPWYDVSYWYEGVRPHFEWKGQRRALFRSANMYLKFVSKSGALWVVFVALLFARRAGVVWGIYGWGTWLVALPAVAALGMYSLVLVEFRYVAPFALMLLMGMLSKMRIRAGAELLWLKRSQLVVILAPALAVGWAAGRDAVEVVCNEPYEPWAVAQQLHEMGIPAGADVGYIGTGLDAYWAHLAGVRIIAEIPDSEEPRYVTADATRKKHILALFSSVGAKAVLTKNSSIANPADGWRPIAGTHHFIWQAQLLIAAPTKEQREQAETKKAWQQVHL
jgi:hypothetical protein